MTAETWGDVFARCRSRGMDASDAAFRADEWARRQKGKPAQAVYGSRPLTGDELSCHWMEGVLVFPDMPEHVDA